MSSLARRSLRTTAAAAGIAAISAGLAGPALAAPALPEAPAELPQAPADPALPSPTEALIIPGVVNIEAPTVSTAGPELPIADAFELPDVAELGLPAATEADAAEADAAEADVTEADLSEASSDTELPENGVVDGAFDVGDDADAETVATEAAPQAEPEVGAMQGLDAAELFLELSERAIAGESPTEGNEID